MLVALLVIVAVLAALVWFRPDASVATLPTNSATSVAARAAEIAPTATFTGQTAKVAFAAAQRAALAWQNDAALLNATATWNQGANEQQLLDGEATWGFTFYSPADGAIATISVIDDQASLVASGASPQPTQPLDVTGWTLDSRDAIEQFLQEGGTNFIKNEGVTTLTMMLSTENRQQNGRLEWLLSLFATQTGRSLTVRMDATSGEILEVSNAS
jgi:hypothetical protein